MITAVDTSVLIDVLSADRRFGESSARELRVAVAQGSLVACDVVWAEVAAAFESDLRARDALTRVGVDFSPANEATAFAAGKAWKEYRRRGGTRDRLIADFLIGAHAATVADRLLTRDRGFYRTYFSRLKLLEPALP